MAPRNKSSTSGSKSGMPIRGRQSSSVRSNTSLIQPSRAQIRQRLTVNHNMVLPNPNLVLTTQAMLNKVKVKNPEGAWANLVTSDKSARYTVTISSEGLRNVDDASDKNLCLLIWKDGNRKPLFSIDFFNNPCRLEVKVYEEEYSIELVEKTKNKPVRTWGFKLATNDMEQAKTARNLWNHLCMSLANIPANTLAYVNIPRRINWHRYNLRSTTRRAQIVGDQEARSNTWTIFLPANGITWHFTGFVFENRVGIEELESGAGDDDDNDDGSGEFQGRRSGKRQTARQKREAAKRTRKAVQKPRRSSRITNAA